MVVYVVTAHTSEGRKIKAVFEDRKQAECCCALLDGDDSMLEAWDTDGIKITGNATPLAEWLVLIKPDGSVIGMDRRYTFTEMVHHSWDLDGSCAVRMTHPTVLSEDRVKEIALNYWRQLEKPQD